MKIASWNIEWMNRWFSSDQDTAAWRNSSQISGVTDIADLAQRVAGVITEMEPDVLMIQEGPSRYDEIKLFVDDCLNDDYTIVGPSGKGQQKLYALIKNNGAVEQFERAYATGTVDIEEPWSVDIDGVIMDGQFSLEEYEFTRVPLMVDISDGQHDVRIINVHLKSKYIHNGESLWNNPTTRPAFIVDAVKTRRRISAEAMRLREYLNELLVEDGDKAIIVCGDFNDGPGSDFFERLYLTHNLVAAVSGNPFTPNRMFRHGFADRMSNDDNYTAIFDDFIDEIPARHILLDHILVSPGLTEALIDGRIDHEAYNNGKDMNKPGNREKLPSDHRPSWITY